MVHGYKRDIHAGTQNKEQRDDRYETTETEREYIAEAKVKSQYCTDRDSASPRIQPEPGPPPFQANPFHARIIPPSPAYAYASAGMTAGVPVFKLSGSDTWSTKAICTVRSSPRLSDDASVAVGETFSVGVGEYSLSGVGIREP